MNKLGTQKNIVIFIHDIINSIFQLFSKVLMLLFQIIFQPRVLKPANLRVPRGTLIISNHQSELDPWLVCHYIPFKDFVAMLPVRYPVTARYMRKPLLGLLIRCFGGYDIGLTPLEKAKKLLYTRDLIYAGYTVMLFPEGKISNGELGEFKKGLHMLAQENIPFLLVRISGLKPSYKFNNISLKFSSLIHNIPAEEKLNQVQEFFDFK